MDSRRQAKDKGRQKKRNLQRRLRKIVRELSRDLGREWSHRKWRRTSRERTYLRHSNANERFSEIKLERHPQ